jgi:NAD(P)-dependent dehydrogenase (short-subunit alcohol dehydrogenase family)
MDPRPDYGDGTYRGFGRLRDKVAVVTGADSGIGRAVALAFAREGADVVVAYLDEHEDARETQRVVEAAGRRALLVAADLSTEPACRGLVERAAREMGRIDVLVNNAGGPVFNAPFLEIRPDGWRRVLELNLLSVVGFTQAVGAHMVQRGSGSVINIDSIGAAHPGPFVSPYCAAKAAVVNLTLVLAQDWGPAGVRINAVSPGWVRTEINRAVYEHAATAGAVAARIPLRRWGDPADVVGAAIWLASDASAYVTGAHIPIDGGVGVVAPQAPEGPSARSGDG